MRSLILMAPALFAASSSLAEPLADRATVLDGDSIELAGTKIRLVGIDAGELRQSCKDGQGREAACGKAAAKALSAMIGKSMATCDAEGSDSYGRTLAVCKAGGIDLNARNGGDRPGARLRTTPDTLPMSGAREIGQAHRGACRTVTCASPELFRYQMS